MGTKVYSQSPVGLLEPSHQNGHSADAVSVRIKADFPGIRSWEEISASEQDQNPGIILLPVSDYAEDSLLEKLDRWLKNSAGTVIRTATGEVFSRIIPVSVQGGGNPPKSISRFLDGTRNEIQGIGQPGSPDQSRLVALVDRLIQASLAPLPATPDRVGIEAYIRKRFTIDFPPLAYHNPVHIEDVYEASVRIADAEGVDEAGIHLLRVGALFHDAGFIHGTQAHEQRGADMVAGVMPAFGYSQQQIAIVRQMIMATKVPQMPASLLDRILCDADLDYLGRDDFYPIGNRLYEELKGMGVVQDDRSWNTLQRKFLTAHSYHTDYCRTHREPAKQVRIKEIEAKLV